MRKAILLALLHGAAAAYGQQTEPTPASPKEEYLLKSKSQKAGAWLLIGAGLIITAVTAENATSNIMEPTSNTGLYIAGASVCGSAVLFVAAARNKRKAGAAAVAAAFKMEQSSQPAPGGITAQSFPSLAVRVRL